MPTGSKDPMDWWPQRPRTLHEEYLTCQTRGHKSSTSTFRGNRTIHICDHCKTQYWIEKVTHEIGVPTPQPEAKPDPYPAHALCLECRQSSFTQAMIVHSPGCSNA